jgi:hypothetical protein
MKHADAMLRVSFHYSSSGATLGTYDGQADYFDVCRADRVFQHLAGTIPCVQAFVELLAIFAPPENARHELGSSHRHDRKRRRGAKA